MKFWLGGRMLRASKGNDLEKSIFLPFWDVFSAKINIFGVKTEQNRSDKVFKDIPKVIGVR